jgi:hypothetical protein
MGPVTATKTTKKPETRVPRDESLGKLFKLLKTALKPFFVVPS